MLVVLWEIIVVHILWQNGPERITTRRKRDSQPYKGRKKEEVSLGVQHEVPRAQVGLRNILVLLRVLRNTCYYPKGTPIWDHWTVKERGPPTMQGN